MPAFSGLWNNEFGEDHSLLSSRVGNNETALAKLLANRIYARGAFRELMDTLTGATAGATALLTHKRVAAVADPTANVQGGARTIETFTEINRATTSADRADIRDALVLSSKPSAYAADKSGNGGGGKGGF